MMDIATTNGTVMISLEATFADLAESLEACLQAVVVARPAHRSSLPALRLALRCLASLIRLTRLQPAFQAATIAHIQQVLAVTQEEYLADHADPRASLGLLAVRITCQTHLTRLAAQQLRASKRSEPHHHGPPSATPSARSPVAPAAPRPQGATVILGDQAVISPPPSPTHLTQRAKWRAEQEQKRAKRA